MPEARLDRQLRIEGWDQQRLEKAKVAVIGDDDLLASLYVMSAAALGLNNLVIIAPRLDARLLETARRVNPKLNLVHIEGFYVHPLLDDLFQGCDIIVDLSHYGLANKLLLQKGFDEGIPVVRGFYARENGEHGFKIFTYLKGREWEELGHIISPHNLPHKHADDGVVDIIASGLVLEETKNILMAGRLSEDIISYGSRRWPGPSSDPNICVVGAGALGNFVGLGLIFSGFRRITFMDPDVVEITNLNRQVFLTEALGMSKAEALAARLNTLFGSPTRSEMAYLGQDTDISVYDVVFDCVDNFETRIVLSEKCRDQHKVLISGGTSESRGQVVVYDPARAVDTPAALLGLYEIVQGRDVESCRRIREACTYRPDPSVIMSNQIIAGLMVDSYRMVLAGAKPGNLFYDSTTSSRVGA